MRNKTIFFYLLLSCIFLTTAYPDEEVGRIPKNLLKGIVKIQTPAGITGTGFLVSKQIPLKTDSVRVVFLVTNKHIIGDWNAADGNIQNYYNHLNVFFYSKTRTDQTLTKVALKDSSGILRVDKIFIHPDPRKDVVIINVMEEIANNSLIDLLIFDVSYLLKFNDIMNWFTGLGDQVFALGYPLGITSLKNNFPIAKSGYLASLPGEEFAIDINVINRKKVNVKTRMEGKFLLIDGLIVGGNSGGPVVLPSELAIRRNPKTNKVEFGSEMKKNYVIGIVSSALGPSGLSVCLSSDYILEMIEKYFENIKMNLS